MVNNKPILRAKISCPLPPANLVPRARLYRRLSEGTRRPLTIVAAPAGFGKTALVTGWVHDSKRRTNVAWLLLDGDDNDPFRFLSYVIAALTTLDNTIGEAAQSAIGSLRRPALRDLMALLLNDFAANKQRRLLVFEDFHVISNPEVDGLVTYAIDHLPRSLRIIINSRAEPRLPLPRWRANDMVSELGLRDLRFTDPEASAFLRRTMGLNVAPRIAQALDERSEGWIAGLQMSALWLKARNGGDGVEPHQSDIHSFDGTHRFVTDYLASEVFESQSEETRAFLRSTCILDRLSAPLCDAVAQVTNSRKMLTFLERENLFLLRLDDRRLWFRYHQLFRDFLLAGLDGRERVALHRRASIWFADNGFSTDALRHAMAAGDIVAAISLIRGQMDQMLSQGEFSTVLGWLDSLPMDVVRQESDLSGFKAWLLYLRGRISEAKSFITRFESKGLAPVSRSGPLLAFQAFLAINRGSPKDALPLARAALEYLSGGESYFRASALSLLGNAQRLAGHRTDAIVTLREAIKLGQKLHNRLIALDAIGDLVPLLYSGGKLREGVALCKKAVEEQVTLRGDPLPAAGLVHVRLGSLLYELDELNEANDALVRGIDLCTRLGVANYVYLGNRTLAKVAHARGELELAWDLLASAMRHADQSENSRQRRLVDITTAELLLRDGNVTAASRAIGLLDEWTEAATELERITYARLLLAQDRPRMAASILAETEDAARKDNRAGTLITILVLQALAKKMQGADDPALRLLSEAVALAAPAGYRRTFVDAGSQLIPILAKVTAEPAFVKRILARLEQPARPPFQPQSGDQLTKTEIEVLRLLSLGLANKTIATRLSISVGTTKWHLHNIFEKLEVSNRTAAIVKARQFEFL